MKVLNRNGSISAQEWDVSRMYVAVKFRKIKESQIEVGGEDVGPDEMIDPN
jgi:mRNA (guanine-N7-)-methyltransferase